MARRVGYTVRRLRSGRWQVLVTDAAGDRVGIGSFPDKQSAEEAGQAESVRVRAGTWVDPRRADIPLADYLADWLQRRKRTNRHGVRYAEDAARMVRLHITPAIGRVVLTDLTPQVVSRWYDDLVAKQLESNRAQAERLAAEHAAAAKRLAAEQSDDADGAGKVRRVKTPRPVPHRVTEGLVPAKTYRLLHAALQDAVRDQLLVVNPCMVPGAGVEHSVERPLLEPEQVLDLADAVRPKWRAMVLLAGWCGMAFGELAGLRRSDVDLLHGTIRVERGTGETSHGVFDKDPKTRARRRTVTLPQQLVGVVTEHLEQWVGPEPDARVFTSPKGAPLRRSTFGEFRDAVASVGLVGVTFHDLRHAAGTLAAQLGATERELQARLGHASPDAARRYQHAAERRDRELSDRIGAAFAEVTERRSEGAPVQDLRAHSARKRRRNGGD